MIELKQPQKEVNRVSQTEFILRHPTKEDGTKIWELIQDVGVLDLNTCYAYLMMADYFSNRCIVAENSNGDIVGFVTGFIPPKKPDTLFVWQVGCHPSTRGCGLATKMIMDLLSRKADQLKYIETTVSPSNVPSRKLFEGLARKLETELRVEEGYKKDLFPESHEPEPLLIIGPFSLEKSSEGEK